MTEDNKRPNKRKKLMVIAVIALVAVLGIAGFLVYRFIPSNTVRSGYKYFDVKEDVDNEYVIIQNGEKIDEKALMIGDHLYFSRKFTFDNFNKRFYYDSESDAVLKTDGNTTWIFKAGENSYTSTSGKKEDDGYPVIVKVDDTLYVAADYAIQDGGFAYSTYSEPQRVILKTKYETYTEVEVQSDTQVRFRGGVKSDILEEVSTGDRLIYRKDVGGWLEVETPSGYIGYVKSSATKPIEENAIENFTPIRSYVNAQDRPGELCITWYQLGSKMENSDIDKNLIGIEATNVLSPTWFAITDDKGSMTDSGSGELTQKMHDRGIKVWGLVNDFATNIDRDSFMASKAVREKVINNLIQAANKYNLDGINIDFEKISKPGSEHYLQFLRELALECRANGLVLSVDDARPYAFNYQYEVGEQAAYVDYVILMAYDEHYNGSEPGSVASLTFTEEGIQAMLRSGVPANQLVLGMPFYTRVYFTDKNGNVTSNAVSMQVANQICDDAGAPGTQVDGQTFRSYENDEGKLVQVWIENSSSLELRMKLMEQYNLAGSAQWKLGMEEKKVWEVIRKYTK